MSNPGLYKTLYRILSWGSLIGLALTLVLVLRKSPPPDVPTIRKPRRASIKNSLQPVRPRPPDSPRRCNSIPRNSIPTCSRILRRPDRRNSSPPDRRQPQPQEPRRLPQSGDANADPMAALSSGDAATLEQVQSSVKDVKVDMDGDLVKAYVVFDFHGQGFVARTRRSPRRAGRLPEVRAGRGKLGSLPLPQSTLDAAVAKMMSSPENREKLKLPDDISDIQIQNGHAVVSYK